MRGGNGAHRQGADLDLLAGAHLRHVRDAGLALDQCAGALRRHDGQLPAEALQRGHVEVVVVQVRDQHRVDAAERRGIDLRGPAQVRDPVAEQRIREQLDTREIDENGAVPDVVDARSRGGG